MTHTNLSLRGRDGARRRGSAVRWPLALAALATAITPAAASAQRCPPAASLQRLARVSDARAVQLFRRTLFDYASRPPDPGCELSPAFRMVGLLEPVDGCPSAVVGYASTYDCERYGVEHAYAVLRSRGAGFEVVDHGLPPEDPRVMSARSDLPDLDGDGLRDFIATRVVVPEYAAFRTASFRDDLEENACVLPETREAVLVGSASGRTLAGPVVVSGLDPAALPDRTGLPERQYLDLRPADVRCPPWRGAWTRIEAQSVTAGRDERGFFVRARVERRACRGLLAGEALLQVAGAGACGRGEAAEVVHHAPAPAVAAAPAGATPACASVAELRRLEDLDLRDVFGGSFLAYAAGPPPDPSCTFEEASVAGYLEPRRGCPSAVVSYVPDWFCPGDSPAFHHAIVQLSGEAWTVVEDGIPEGDPRVRRARR